MNLFKWSEQDKAKFPAPTEKVKLYGVLCFYDDKTGAMWGVTPMQDYLISVVTFIHNLLCELGLTEGGPFPLEVVEEYPPRQVEEAAPLQYHLPLVAPCAECYTHWQLHGDSAPCDTCAFSPKALK